jgi:hypothetical protein
LPDLQKPFFVSQMSWRLAFNPEKRAEKREKELEVLEAQRKESRTRKEGEDQKKQKQNEAILKDLKNPEHLRKRKKQAEKRKSGS